MPFWLLWEFTAMVWYSRFDEWWQDVTLKDDCIVLDVQPLCDDFDIEAWDVFVWDHYDSLFYINLIMNKRQDFDRLSKILNYYEKNKMLNKYWMFKWWVFILNSTQRHTMYKEIKDMESKWLLKSMF